MKKILCFLLTAMLLLTSAVILPVAADDAVEPTETTYIAPIYYGAQAGTGTNAGTQKIRFISLVPANTGKALGYEIVVKYDGNVVRYSAAEGDEKMESNVVYSSLLAGDYNEAVTTADVVADMNTKGTYTGKEAYGLFVVVIDNVPVAAQFDVRTYVKEDSTEPEDKSGCTGVTLATDGTIGTATPAKAWATQGGDGTAAYPYVLNQKNFLAFYDAEKSTGQWSYLTVACELESDIVINDNWDATSGTTPEIVWNVPLRAPSGYDFEGNGYTISGVCVKNTQGAINTGLFMELHGATISNLNITNSYFEAVQPAADKTIGSVVGFMSNATITNCYSDAIVVSNRDDCGKQSVGGIVGRMSDNTTVSNCVFAGSISAARTCIGGIVGYSSSGNVVVTNCLNLGNIWFTGTNSGVSGGILGVAERYSSSSIITVSSCVNLSSSIAAVEGVGNIVGRNIVPSNALFTSCYTVSGYCITEAGHGVADAYTKVDSLANINIDGWYYVDGYLPSPIEGLLIEIPQ